jgi:hypothetical protein
MVTISYPKRGVGDQSTTLSLEKAIPELEAAMGHGYTVSRKVVNEQQVMWEAIQDLDNVQEDDEVQVTPTGMGG